MILLIFTYVPSVSASSASTDRIAGYDRYLTAVKVSQNGWPDGASTAILALGDDFPDALSAGPLAQKYNAPILLTSTYQLNSDTATELKRLNVKKVYIIGGYAVVSKDVERQISMMGIAAVRISGQDRYETSLKVAQEVGVSQGIFATNGLTFADALSVGPIAAALKMPILLVPPKDLTPVQKDFLSKSNIPVSYILVGREISNNVVYQFPNYEIIYGSNPYERNINLINRFKDSLDLNTIYVATGELFPDALAASALIQKNKNALILLQGDSIPYPAQNFISSKLISNFIILGGTSVISGSTESKLSDLPAEITSVDNISDSIEEQQKYDPPKTVTVTTTNGTTEEVPVTWSLSSVRTLKSGTYKFEGKIDNYSDPVYLNLTIQPKVSKVNNITAEIIIGDTYSFPDTVDALMSDGSTETYPVTWNSKVVPVNKAGTYTFQGTIEGLTQKVSLSLKVSEDAKITFADPELYTAIRHKLHKSSSKSIYKSDALDVTSLFIRSEGITNLSGLEYFSNLKTLDLSHNTLTNIAPLSKLTKLQTLKLHDTEIKDVNAIKDLTSLTYLDITDNFITNFTSLKNLTNLTTLYLSDNEPFTPDDNYTPDYSPIRAYYDDLDKKDFSL
ncbi:cell wall-binding repeat-containing protein [Desulfosporosinus orientis]|nr:cell wall-binding repeat-containing protein [Desulfosporosinus orientis]